MVIVPVSAQQLHMLKEDNILSCSIPAADIGLLILGFQCNHDPPDYIEIPLYRGPFIHF